MKRIPLIIFLTLASLYILFGYGVTITNDSVTNIEQIVSLNIWSRSSHFSFHLIGVLFYLFFSKFLGLSAVTSIEIMLAVISAGASVALYKIVLNKFNNVNQAIITVIIYSIASGIFRFSSQVEYIVLVPSLGIISLYFYSKGQFITAGIIFSFGLLTSVLIILFTPMFLLFTTFKELIKRHNIIFVFFSIIIFLLVNLFTYQETVSGTWSYGGEVDYYKQIISKINYLRPTAIFIYGYLRSFNIVLIFLPFILIYLFRHNKELFYLLIITVLIHIPLTIPEARYGGYQMTAYPILAISAGYFYQSILSRRRYLVYSVIFLYIFINIFIVSSERSFFNDLKDTYVKLNNSLKSKSILIVYQASKPLKNVYATNLKVYDIKSDYLDKIAEYSPGYVSTDFSEIFKNNDTIYLLESGQSMPDDHLKLLFNNFTKNQGAKVKGFALEKILTTNPLFYSEKLKDYPLDVYRLTKNE